MCSSIFIFISCSWFMIHQCLIINKILLYLFRNHLKSLSIISLIVFILFSLGYTSLLNGFSHPYHPYFNFYFHTFFCCIGALFAKYQRLLSLRTDMIHNYINLLLLNIYCHIENRKDKFLKYSH